MSNQVETRTVDGATVVSARGEFDLSNVAVLREALWPQITPSAWVILDLTEVPFADSSVIGVTVGAWKHATATAARLHVVLPSGSSVRKVFDITGVTEALDVVESLDEALNEAGGVTSTLGTDAHPEPSAP